jgi:hypothetical protein
LPAQRGLEREGKDEEGEGGDRQQEGEPIPVGVRLDSKALEQHDDGARRQRQEVVLHHVPEVLRAEHAGGVQEHVAGATEAIHADLERRRAQRPAERIERDEVEDARQHGEGEAPEVARGGRLRAQQGQGDQGGDEEGGQRVHRHGEGGQEAGPHE